MEFLNNHTTDLAIIAAAGITHAAASFFTAMSKTPTRRSRWGQVYRIIEFIALNVNKAKEKDYS